ncbi:MAG: methyltransferase domain-containing protein [Bacteroidales bacterium]|nr:methyltransferase domain-containing protein [Bacteroidales bacterium]
MNLFPNIEKAYTKDRLPARDAQRLAQFIAFGPIVFQASRLMLKFGILEALRDNPLTLEEVAGKAGISIYAAKVLLEASLSIGTVIIDTSTDKYSITKTGWFLLTDPSARVNIDFNHDVNYEGFFHLEEALKEGRPAGLDHFGSWPTIYEGLSSLPPQVQKSWFGFDHFYSDHSFLQALEIIFSFKPLRIMDVGGNTGRFAQRAVAFNEDVKVTIVDLPQQIGLMRKAVAGMPGEERIDARPMNLLDRSSEFPTDVNPDIIWMSQFLDCFAEDEILSILSRARKIMKPGARLLVMETFWDRQKYEPASFCLTMTSLYFTAMANGNSKMYHSDDMIRLVREAGLDVEAVHDGLGQGHSILVCKTLNQ